MVGAGSLNTLGDDMNLATGPFDMFFNHGGWREFLEPSGPALVFIILCGVGSIPLIWGLVKDRQGLMFVGLSLSGFAIASIMIDWKVMAFIWFPILIGVAIVYRPMSAIKEREKQGGGPAGGHKPVRVVEAAQPTSSPRDQSGDSAP